MYHFLSGYTAKVAGTEKGLVGVQPEFSTCFGAPFLPRHPTVYGNLLRELIAVHNVDCWLVNTGWTAGSYGVGRRMPIKVTRTLLDRRARRLAAQRQIPHRSVFRLLGADLGAGHRAASALSVQDLAEQIRVRRDRAQAGRDVPEELRAVRDPRRRRRARRAAGSADRGGIARADAGAISWREAVPAAEAANYLRGPQDWLDRRKEPILEPELPIIDPHHHLWDRAGWRYLLDDLLADTNSGHNILATVFVQARAMHRAGGPEEMKPVGETEFVNGVAAMTASGIYGKIRACAGIVGHANLTARQPGRAGAGGA